MKVTSRSVDDLPREREVKVALEALLRKLNRSITPPEAYAALADEFRLTIGQRSQVMTDGRVHWTNRVQSAREKLAKAGIMARKPRGVWRLAKP